MKARKIATKAVLWLIQLTRNEEMASFWAWEMTPIPIGLPSWRQIRVGFALGLGLDSVARKYRKEVEAEEERILGDYYKSK